MLRVRIKRIPCKNGDRPAHLLGTKYKPRWMPLYRVLWHLSHTLSQADALCQCSAWAQGPLSKIAPRGYWRARIQVAEHLMHIHERARAIAKGAAPKTLMDRCILDVIESSPKIRALYDGTENPRKNAY